MINREGGSGGTHRDGWLALLLMAYPRSFRERFGAELLDSLKRDRGRPVFRGPWGRVRFLVHALKDVGRTAPGAWTGGGDARPKRERSNSGAWLRDLQFILRALRREPGFTAVAVLTIGLGIGAATAVFTVVYAVLLAPLPYSEPDRLVRVWELERDNPGARMVAYGNYEDLRTRGEGRIFDDLGIWAYSAHTLTGTGPAIRLRTRQVSANFARVFRQSPILGRWVSPDEERLGANVVVFAYHLWRDEFGLDSTIVGRAVRLEDEPYTVVGVMPSEFVFPPTADAWVPLEPVNDPMGLRRWHRHAMVGRIAGAATTQDVQAALRVISDDLSARWPDTNTGNYFEAQSLQDVLVGSVRPILRMLFGACGVLLLIACVNIASLLLARTTARSRELAVRSALGASRVRLLASLALESLVLAGLGGALGSVIAIGTTSLLPRFAAETIPRVEQVRVGLPIFLFAAFASVLSAMIVSVGPALRGTGRDDGPAAALRTGRSGATVSAIRNRRFLVGAELALAVVLVATAGLLIRSFGRLTAVNPGIQADRVATMDVRVPVRGSSDGSVIARRIDDMLRMFEQMPEVEGAAVVLTEPADPSGWFNTLTIRDQPVPEAERPAIGYNVVSQRYFDVLGVPIIAGRTFGAADGHNADRVVIINRAAAERYFFDRDPVGEAILGNPDADSGWARVVGVVDNIRQNLWEPAWPEVFVLLEQEPLTSVVVVARVVGDPDIIGPALAQAARRWEPDMPVANVGALADRIGSTINEPRFSAFLMGTFAGVALLLASVGVFGVLSYTVAERRHEFAIRMAVGAPRRRVLVAVMREAGTLAVAGVILGAAGAFGVSRLVEGLLFQVGRVDAGVLMCTAAVVIVVAMVAGTIPARAATAVDPAGVLRDE